MAYYEVDWEDKNNPKINGRLNVEADNIDDSKRVTKEYLNLIRESESPVKINVIESTKVIFINRALINKMKGL